MSTRSRVELARLRSTQKRYAAQIAKELPARRTPTSEIRKIAPLNRGGINEVVKTAYAWHEECGFCQMSPAEAAKSLHEAGADSNFWATGDVAGEAGDRERDPQHVALWPGGRQPLDIVGRIPVTGGFRQPFQRALDFVEAEQ